MEETVDDAVRRYTVQASFNDAYSSATVDVEAGSIEEACDKAIELIDNGDVPTIEKRGDAGPTYVDAIRLGEHGTAWDNDSDTIKVPRAYTEAFTYMGRLEQTAPALLTALEDLVDCCTAVAKKQSGEFYETYQRAKATITTLKKKAGRRTNAGDAEWRKHLRKHAR